MEGVLSGKGWGEKDRQRNSKARVESQLERIASLIPRGTLEQELDHKIGPTSSKVVFCALLLHQSIITYGPRAEAGVEGIISLSGGSNLSRDHPLDM